MPPRLLAGSNLITFGGSGGGLAGPGGCFGHVATCGMKTVSQSHGFSSLASCLVFHVPSESVMCPAKWVA